MSISASTRRRWGRVGALLASVLLLAVGPARAAAPDPAGLWPLNAAHLDAAQVWPTATGQGVVVAVVDAGVNASHPDLAGQVLEGTSLLGDGGNGQSDTSSESHGTAIAGIIAGSGGPDHTSGMTGLARGAKILPVKVATDGLVLPQDLARGIVWAVDHGAQVVNTSMGSEQPDTLLRQAVDYADRRGVVIIASAGNKGKTGNPPQYPAAYPGVVSVSGVDQTGHFWRPSESGTGITLAAPATKITTTDNQGGYTTVDGTSYAAAYVSATVALLREHYPSLTAGQIIRRMIDTTSQHHDRRDAELGYGVVNPLRALTDPAPIPTDTRNPLLENAKTPAAADSSPVPTVIGVLAGAALVLVIAASVYLALARRRRRLPSKPSSAPAAAGGTRTRGAESGRQPAQTLKKASSQTGRRPQPAARPKEGKRS